MKIKTTILSLRVIYILLGSIFISIESYAQVCTQADLSVSTIEIENVSSTSITYKFVVRNIGIGNLYLDRMYYQATLSQDATKSDFDKAFGGAVMASSETVIVPGGTYTKSVTKSVSNELDLFKYLIIEINVTSGETMPECSVSNNSGFIAIGCPLLDLKVNSLKINTINGNKVNFSYSIKNIGWSKLYLNRMKFKVYVSRNRELDGSDKLSGQYAFSESMEVLTNNESYTSNFTLSAPVDIKVYPFLIIKFDFINEYSINGCHTSNYKLIKFYGCLDAELEIEKVEIEKVDYANKVIEFNYTINNSGLKSIPLNKMVIQTYISEKPELDFSSDNWMVGSGGAVINQIPTNLTTNNNFSEPFNASSPFLGYSKARYLIIWFRENTENAIKECNYENNIIVKTIPLTLHHIPDLEIDWSNLIHIQFKENKTIGIINQERQDQFAEYKIYAIDSRSGGQAIKKGSFVGSVEVDVADVSAGLYMVQVISGDKVVVKKILVTE